MRSNTIRKLFEAHWLRMSLYFELWCTLEVIQDFLNFTKK